MEVNVIIFNEIVLMCANYHAVCFTDFVSNKAQYTMGNSLRYLLILLVVVNFSIMSYNSFNRIKRRLELKELK